MGMFDWVKSSYDLGEQFTNVECQTKDIEEGYSGTMSHFWIDPAGYLWCGDYQGTNTFEIIEENDPRYNSKHLFLNYEWIPTGQHGKYRVYPLTKYIEIYPSDWKGKWEDWPRCRIHFRYGIVQDYEIISRKTQ
jgi:hypothetical protein